MCWLEFPATTPALHTYFQAYSSCALAWLLVQSTQDITRCYDGILWFSPQIIRSLFFSVFVCLTHSWWLLQSQRGINPFMSSKLQTKQHFVILCVVSKDVFFSIWDIVSTSTSTDQVFVLRLCCKHFRWFQLYGVPFGHTMEKRLLRASAQHLPPAWPVVTGFSPHRITGKIWKCSTALYVCLSCLVSHTWCTATLQGMCFYSFLQHRYSTKWQHGNSLLLFCVRKIVKIYWVFSL